MDKYTLTLIVTCVVLVVAIAMTMDYEEIIDALVIFSTGNESISVKVDGVSMEPTLANNSVVNCVRSYKYITGDIIAFTAGNRMIVHRIVGEENDYYVTKGDNNSIPDLMIADKDDVMCKVVLP